MNTKEISQMEKFEKTYWWHVGKKNLVDNLIQHYTTAKNLNILEIGCGAGEITQMLQKYGKVTGNDISQEAIDICQKRGLKNLFQADITKMDVEPYSNTFDLILALDVLEHIQEDVEAMRRIHKMLKPKGIAIISVPAYKFLWSGHDEALEHKRRYTTFELTNKLNDVGLIVKKHSHFVFFAFLPIAFFKFISNFVAKAAYPKSSYIVLPKKLNDLMVKILNIEIKLMSHVRLIFGTTIVAITEKQS